MTIKSKPEKFSGTKESFNKGDFYFIQLFSFRNVCCDRKLCITKATAIVMWHNNCFLLPVARTSKVLSFDRNLGI